VLGEFETDFFAFRFGLQPCMAYVRRFRHVNAASSIQQDIGTAEPVMVGTAPTLRSWNLSILMSITYQRFHFWKGEDRLHPDL
jgi:hypothetical protein